MDEPLNSKALLRMHGATGELLRTVQRFGWVGWLLFVLTAAVFVAYVFVDKIMPTPVLAVDEEGRVLGKFEYLDASVRTDEEVLGGGIRFLRSYLSANSDFIMEDYAEALNMMSEPLRKIKLEQVVNSNYLTRIEGANTTSRLVVSRKEILQRKELQSTVRYRGEIIAQSAGGSPVSQPFDITLTMEAVPRTSLYTYGFKIIRIIDN